jgi:hypothetical protein
VLTGAVCGLFLIIAVAGCSGTSSSSGISSGAGAAAPVDAAPSAAAAGGAVAAASSPAGSSGYSAASDASGASGSAGNAGPKPAAVKYASANQQIVYTAQLSVRAPDVMTAVSRATSIVSAAGGYVSTENASAANGQPGQATATVTLKIPSAAYASTLAALSGGGLGTRLSLEQQAEDVTQQVADVNSRVTSDEAAIAQLRALLAHAGSVADLLDVQNQINSEESDLESMQAQQKSLSAETSYATVTVTVVGPLVVVKPPPPAKSSPPPGFARALSGGAHALHVLVSWLLTIVGAVAPFAAVVLVIGGLVWWGRRRGWRRRTPPPARPGDDTQVI